MHAFIVNSSEFRVQSSPDVLIIAPEKSIGIDEIRQVQSFLSRKPLGDKNSVYVREAHLLTIPAQNALLKILEEPPGNSEIYLVTNRPNDLLSTILSRVQILPTTHYPQPTPVNPVNYDLETLTTRDQALTFLDGVEMYLHQNLNSSMNYEQLTITRKYLKSNCNLKLCLDYFAINFVVS